MVRSSYGFDVSRIAMQTIRRSVPWVLLLQIQGGQLAQALIAEHLTAQEPLLRRIER
jgi:hypothetical protein